MSDTSPVPDSVTGGAWGALEAMVNVAFRAPAAVGVKVSWTAQLAAGATLAPWPPRFGSGIPLESSMPTGECLRWRPPEGLVLITWPMGTVALSANVAA